MPTPTPLSPFRQFYEHRTGRQWGDFMRLNPEIGFGELAECMADWMDAIAKRDPLPEG